MGQGVYKIKLGEEIGYLLSSSSELGPKIYRAIEVGFRDAKDLLSRMCFHTLIARLVVFASCIILAVLRLFRVSKGVWRSYVVSMALQAFIALSLESHSRSLLLEGMVSFRGAVT